MGLFVVAALAILGSKVASAHELMDNRLTIVLRDRTHLSLTFYLDTVDVAHRLLAPGKANAEFLIVYSAMERDLFASAYDRARAQFEQSTRVRTGKSESAPLKNWIWPTAEDLQASIRDVAIKSIVGANEHEHPPPMEVRAEAVASSEVARLRIKVPAELDPILVVSYRPRQKWASPKSGDMAIEF